MWEMPGDKMKRMMKRGMFCIMCVLSLWIVCDDDEDDEHHHPDPKWAYRSLWREERHVAGFS
jgi:hypothetical protein